MVLLNAVIDMIPTMISIAIVSPLILIGGFRASNPDRWKLIGISVLVIFLDAVGMLIESFTGRLQPEGLQYNWSGKLASIILATLVTGLLPSKLRNASGLISLPRKKSQWPVAGFLVACLLLGIVGGIGMLDSPDKQYQVSGEAVAYQLVMPSFPLVLKSSQMAATIYFTFSLAA